MFEGLSDAELLRLLETEGDRLPRAAVDEILRRGERLAPALSALVDDVALWEGEESDREWAAVHATFILAAMKPPGAIETVVRACERAEEWGAADVSDAAPDMLSSFGAEGWPYLRTVARDSSWSPEVRENVAFALGILARKHTQISAEVRAVLRELAQGADVPPLVQETAQWMLLEAAAPEDREFLMTLVEKGDLERSALDAVSKGELEPYEPGNWLDFYDPKAIERRGRMEEEPDEDLEPIDEEVVEELVGPRNIVDDVAEEEGPDIIERTEPKVGRNDPCPCGSGRKYKRCCGG